MIKVLLFLAMPALLLTLSALPGVIIKHRKARAALDAVADFRDTLPAAASLDPEQDEMDARWAAYWAHADREALVLATRLCDYAADTEARVDAFADECEQIVKRFTVDALTAQHAHGNRFGGWDNDVEREAAKIYAASGGNIHVHAHRVAVEKAECTDTAWTEADAAALREYEAELAGAPA